MHGAPNSLIHPTAAEVANHGAIDLIVRGMWSFREQRRRRHDLTALAIPALWHLLGDPRQLYGMIAGSGQPLDGCDFPRSYRGDSSLA
jgi:hypothetical protein